MPTTITATKAIEESTFIITLAFTDEEGDPIAPDTMTWSLVDNSGAVINDREDVVIVSPEITEDIVLSGDDLALAHGWSEEERYLVMVGTYTSNAGDGLPLKDELKFYVENLKKVS